MAKVCAVCGKKPQTGNSVSHAQNKSKKSFKPNIRRVRLEVDGQMRRVRICAQCLRSTKMVAK